MKDLAPHIFRQRLLIEGIYNRTVDIEAVREYFDTLLATLQLRASGEPIFNSSLGMGKTENQGIEAFIPLIDSGVALYTWESSNFLSLIIYTCKAYDNERAVQVTREFFEISEVEFAAF